MRPHSRVRLLASLLVALLCVAEPAMSQFGAPPAPTTEQRTRALRGLLQDARAFLRQGRAESAERTLRRGLAFAPDDAQLNRLLARALVKQGKADAAQEHRRRADEFDPPPTPLASKPMVPSGRGIVVALVPPGVSDEPPTRVPSDWPAGEAANILSERLRVRLPDAKIAFASPESIGSARSWLGERAPSAVLSLRVDRAYCADTLKDGFFAVARLRIAGEVPGTASAGPDERRVVVHNPRDEAGCEAEALSRALERALEHPVVQHALHSAAVSARRNEGDAPLWTTAAIRALFPGIGERIKAELDQGRTQLAGGRVAAATESFRRAAEIDPEDSVTQTYLAEAEATLAMADEIAPVHSIETIVEEDRGVLDPRFSAAQRAAAESRLADERRRRESLLATQEVLKSGGRAPSALALGGLRSSFVSDSRAFGPTTARSLAGGAVGVRDAVAPNGRVIARYYIAGNGNMVLEEGIGSDGRPNTWTAYASDGSRRDHWEDGHGSGTPDVHFVHAPGDDDVARIELDTNRDGEFDRIIDYSDGAPASESRDTNGDGILDRFDHFDRLGFVATRDEDLDGDGEIDARTTYRAGRLVERTFWDLDELPDDT